MLGTKLESAAVAFPHLGTHLPVSFPDRLNILTVQLRPPLLQGALRDPPLLKKWISALEKGASYPTRQSSTPGYHECPATGHIRAETREGTCELYVFEKTFQIFRCIFKLTELKVSPGLQ